MSQATTINGITFTAILYQAKTDPSGGWKITFDVPESDANEILKLSKCRDTILSVGIVPTKPIEDDDSFEWGDDEQG